MEQSGLLPKRPYLLKAYFDWLVDNDLTPYLVVDATYPHVKVPTEYVKDGQIVLNLSVNATGNLQINSDFIQFNARFRGIPQEIYIPMGAALAIYARENGDGVMFEYEPAYAINALSQDQPTDFMNVVENKDKHTNNAKSQAKSVDKKSTSHLRIVK
ncbi:ClpXP protease specificity-enhancing factor [Volucribacter amazonae]|uniref:ClpXP protease specificity-enhancing factor n=1 Tax=Volucribacter amazonae TaxID=256731 RepID=A0A9X4PRJ9_9PAST|nr:ClpXP protease specificity-enhancing factor [Volucribacter amazonae]MDG6896348.1 ClpXP protease specificity-enhancing factor [Volucribacter amazonae]